MPEDYARKLDMFQNIQSAGIDVFLSTAHDALQIVDALFRGGEGVPLPSVVILDYIYGIAAYNWRSNRDDDFNKIKACREEHSANIPPCLSAPPDDRNDSDANYNPPTETSKKEEWPGRKP